MAVIYQEPMYGIIKLIPVKKQKDLSSLAVFFNQNYFCSIMLAGLKLVEALKLSSDLQVVVKIKAKLK